MTSHSEPITPYPEPSSGSSEDPLRLTLSPRPLLSCPHRSRRSVSSDSRRRTRVQAVRSRASSSSPVVLRHQRGEGKKRADDRDHQQADQVVSLLKRLRVSPISDCQRKKRRVRKQRELRNRIRVAVAQSAVPTPVQEARPLLRPPRLDPVFSASSSLSPDRQRHSSDSGRPSRPFSQSPSRRSLQDFSQCRKELETIFVRSVKQKECVQNFSQSQFHQARDARVDDGDDGEETLDASPVQQSSSCAQQARQQLHNDVSVDDLAGYLEDSIVFPKKMSYMAEMMYT